MADQKKKAAPKRSPRSDRFVTDDPKQVTIIRPKKKPAEKKK